MGTCLTSDNRVFLGADGIGIHHLKMYELLFTFGFISTTVNCNNKAEWKWLTSVKLSKCKCLLAWRHKSFFILHQPLWPLNWLLRCPSRLWVAAIQSASKLSSHLNGQVCHTLIQREQKGNYTSFFFLLSIGSAESTFPRHGAGWLKSEQELYSEMAARMEREHWFYWSCVWKESESRQTAGHGTVKVRLEGDKKSLWCLGLLGRKTLSMQNSVYKSHTFPCLCT